MQVPGRGAQLRVAQELFKRHDIHSGFEQVRGITMPKRMYADLARNADLSLGPLKHRLHRTLG